MTVFEWFNKVELAYREGGFEVSFWNGFPMVDTPKTIEDKIKLLSFNPGFGVETRIYAEGALILPAGLTRSS